MKLYILSILLSLPILVAGAQSQVKPTLVKDSRLYVEHFEQSNDGTLRIYDDYLSGDYNHADSDTSLNLNWTEMKISKQTWVKHYKGNIDGTTSTLNQNSTVTWPAMIFNHWLTGTFKDNISGGIHSYNYPPNIVYEKCDLKTLQNFSFLTTDTYPLIFSGFMVRSGRITGTPHKKVVIKFYSGGLGLPKHQSVYLLRASATGVKQTGVSGSYNNPVYQNFTIPSQMITLGAFGQLYPDGILYATIDDGSTKDLTPDVPGGPTWYYFDVGYPQKFILSSQVSCPALTDTNPERTSLGVGETVSLGGLPDETQWRTTAGTISIKTGSGTVFTAPHTAGSGSATVTATIRNVSLPTDFSIVEPSGVQTTVRNYQTDFAHGSVGAGMYLNVVLQPTTVSFAALQIIEPTEPTIATDYFVGRAPAHDGANGGNTWQSVGCNNLINNPSQIFFDHAWSGGWTGPFGQGGTYTWPIHPLWRVVGDTTTHSLSGWTDQIVTLNANGTITVDKLGQQVSHPVW